MAVPPTVGNVEFVQELHRQRPGAVPVRYIRDGDERPGDSVAAPAADDSRVPVIDVRKLDAAAPEERRAELERLADACENWGFFQAVNHGVDQELLDRMATTAREFFKLPLAAKERYPMAPGTVQGYGHAFVFSDEQKLDWCDMFALAIEPTAIRNLDLWPSEPPQFSEILETYSRSVRSLAHRLLGHIFGSLGLPWDTVDGLFNDAVQAIRMNYYPPCPRPDLVLGLAAHSDGSAITMLQQDADRVGLQVRHADTWVPVEPHPRALVINVGDTVEVLTNGRYKSVEHRAVVNEASDRLAIVTFYAPGYGVEIGPLPEVTGDGPTRYRSYNHGEYSKHYLSKKLEGKRRLEEFAMIATDS